ncbi:MAG: ergothioneine biosynthesis protein EgtB [Betaproteobacteria bacterium]|jgi:ergothioneine biosynthesis protein EgtB
MSDLRIPHAVGAGASGAALSERYAAIRAHSAGLARPLSQEDCCAQSMPDASPTKWHLAHTTWFFETFILEKYEAVFTPFMPAFRVMFNSYYNDVGEKLPRQQRGMLTRPALHEVMLYRRQVDARMKAVFASHADDSAFCALVELGLNHEQQHQELILTDIKHLLSINPLKPAYRAQVEEAPATATAQRWQALAGGLVEIGHVGSGFHFDNETPRHKQYLNSYCLAARLVNNGEYLDFILDGGYHDPRLWLSEGWDWLQANAIAHPFYWARGDDRWDEFSLGGMGALDPLAPAVHLCYFEADAYARWTGARLPSEAEWENAAAERGLQQMFGAAWQWTQSSYASYPGYVWPAGAVGEYNGKFMVNQYVLRGSSGLTPTDHSRATYRNFFPATARWQMTGIRLAKDGVLL